jgi:outer membrane autotransporter protein
MNKNHRVIWSAVRQCFVVAGENANAKGKPSSTRTAIAAAVSTLLFAPGIAAAAPLPPLVITTELISSHLQFDVDQDVTIGPSGSIKVAADDAIHFFDSYNATFTNNGVITATDTKNISAVSFESLSGTFENKNSISASATQLPQGNSVNGVFVDFLSGTINNHSIISTTSSNLVSTNFARGINVNEFDDGTINNYGTIVANGPIAESIYVTNGTGTINNKAGGLLDGQVNLGGSINLINDGTLDTRQNLSRVGGNYSQGATGTLKIGAINANVRGALNVTGNANFAAGSTIEVNATPTNTLVIGNVIASVVHTDGTLTVANKVITTSGKLSDIRVIDNILGMDFNAYSNGAHDIDLLAVTVKSLSSVVNAVQGAGLSSAVGAASVLDTLLVNMVNQPAEINTFLASLTSAGLTTERQVADRVSQILPTINTGATQTTVATIHGITGLIQQRQDGNNNAAVGASSGDTLYSDKHVWMKPFGSWANQSDRGGVSGYSANTYGMVFGVDGEISDVNRIGAAFAYARSKIDGNSSVATQNASVSSYQATVYGSHKISPATHLDYQFDIGVHDNDGTRQINGIGTARSSYNSISTHAGVALGHNLRLDEKTVFTPSIRADYTWVRNDGYSETGVGALNLNVNKNNAKELILGVDGKVSHALSKRAALIANLGVGYDVINEATSLTSAFAGAPTLAFTTTGINPSPWLARGGVGIVGQVSKTLEISARYDFEVRKDFDNQTASIKARWAF